MIMAVAETSLPVPDSVTMLATLAHLGLALRYWTYSVRSPSFSQKKAMAFAVSMTVPPPTARMKSIPSSLHRRTFSMTMDSLGDTALNGVWTASRPAPLMEALTFSSSAARYEPPSSTIRTLRPPYCLIRSPTCEALSLPTTKRVGMQKEKSFINPPSQLDYDAVCVGPDRCLECLDRIFLLKDTVQEL